MDNPFTFVISESFSTAAHSTSDLEAGIYSLLKALELLDDTSYSGTTKLAAYAFVDAHIVAAGANPWLLQRYRQLVAGKVNFYSQHA